MAFKKENFDYVSGSKTGQALAFYYHETDTTAAIITANYFDSIKEELKVLKYPLIVITALENGAQTIMSPKLVGGHIVKNTIDPVFIT